VKRLPPAVAALAILWIRQLRFERRLSIRQGWWEREAAHQMERHGEEVQGVFERWAKQINENFRRVGGRMQ